MKCFLMFNALKENMRTGQFRYRAQGEIYNVANIDKVTAEIFKGWRGQLMVSNGAIICTKPSVKA